MHGQRSVCDAKLKIANSKTAKSKVAHGANDDGIAFGETFYD
jgi:hypothetical protein